MRLRTAIASATVKFIDFIKAGNIFEEFSCQAGAVSI
jgi:hypothetical protein